MDDGGRSQHRLMADLEEPLVLAGPPRAIRGEFRLENPTDEKVIVRQPLFRAVAPKGKKAARAAEAAALPETGLALRRIVMRPGQARPVPVALQLDPRLPPGTYHAELAINDQSRSVVIHVTEDIDLDVTPDQVILANAPGEKVKRTLVFTNRGNVPIAIGTVGTVVLDDDLAHCRALRGALEDVGDTMKGLDDFAAALGRRYKKLYETLVLKVQNGAVTLAPGETQAVDLTITLPKDLDSHSRYTGAAAIATISLPFIIVPD
jgi:hypothetical protein